MDGPILWFLNRGSGFVLLALLSLTVVVGVLATRNNAGGRVPRFLTQTVHRDLGLLSVVLLVVHVVTAVTDSFVDISWWQAFSPIGATYEPLWLGLGTLVLDILLVIVGTSLLRHRLSHRSWRRVHLCAYGAWAIAVVHGLGIGTDTGTGFATATYAVCVISVALALAVRLRDVSRRGGAVAASADDPAASGVLR
jgi:sulfoxide reductase heme-binding subunit YedZ